MSLVSLTFGNGRGKMSAPSNIQILHRPEDSIRVEPGKEPKLEVQKISTFLGFNGVYIIGKVKSGVIAPSMMGISPTGKTFRVTEIESKYPNCAVAKQGMTVGLSVEGVGKEDVLDVKELTFVAN
jgi:translation elongation factor EF-1alpha